MKALDLFCKAGGTSMGLHRAGFDVTGVDIEPQPRYPFEFILANALEYVAQHGREYDLIVAGPPCQVHSVLAHLSNGTHLDLIPDTRAALVASGKPYFIENVPGSPLINPLILCGTMFSGLKTACGARLRRHRLFECSVDIWWPPGQCKHIGQTIGIFGDKARDTAAEKRHYLKPKEIRGLPDNIGFSLLDARAAMGIDWMNFKELSQAIPPAYTEWLGREMLRLI